MERRRAASGRPSGTDGSDFSYRMLVDPRYTKVAQAKSRLRALLAAQTCNLVVGSLLVFLFSSKEEGLKKFARLAVSIGFISLVIGELGRRHSQKNLLRLYISMSSIATAFPVAYMVRSGLFYKVIQYQNALTLRTYELVEAGCILFSIVLQILIIITTVTLLHNMSPKRAS